MTLTSPAESCGNSQAGKTIAGRKKPIAVGTATSLDAHSFTRRRDPKSRRIAAIAGSILARSTLEQFRSRPRTRQSPTPSLRRKRPAPTPQATNIQEAQELERIISRCRFVASGAREGVALKPD